MKTATAASFRSRSGPNANIHRTLYPSYASGQMLPTPAGVSWQDGGAGDDSRRRERERLYRLGASKRTVISTLASTGRPSTEAGRYRHCRTACFAAATKSGFPRAEVTSLMRPCVSTIASTSTLPEKRFAVAIIGNCGDGELISFGGWTTPRGAGIGKLSAEAGGGTFGSPCPIAGISGSAPAEAAPGGAGRSTAGIRSAPEVF